MFSATVNHLLKKGKKTFVSHTLHNKLKNLTFLLSGAKFGILIHQQAILVSQSLEPDLKKTTNMIFPNICGGNSAYWSRNTINMAVQQKGRKTGSNGPVLECNPIVNG